MKRLAVLIPLLCSGYAAPLAADSGAQARALFARICIDEAMKLGHRDDALRKYVEACVNAKFKVYDDDMSDPEAANRPMSC